MLPLIQKEIVTMTTSKEMTKHILDSLFFPIFTEIKNEIYV